MPRVKKQFNRCRYTILVVTGIVWGVFNVNAENGRQTDALFGAAWESAVARVKSGAVRTGLVQLDSLRRSTPGPDDSVLAEYVRLVNELFLPNVDEMSSGPVVYLFDTADAAVDDYPGDDALTADGVSVTITAANNAPQEMPLFLFDRTFTARERFRLWLPPLSVCQHYEKKDLLAYDSCRILQDGALVHNLDEQPWPLQLRVIVDCRGGEESLLSYVANMVTPQYDYVQVRSDRGNGKSISLRCYTRQVFRTMPARVLGIVAFERYGITTTVAAGKKKKSGGQEMLRVRYVILVKANKAVEERMEYILARISSALN